MFFCFSHLIFFLFFSYSLFSLCRSVVLLPCLVIGSAFEKKRRSKGRIGIGEPSPSDSMVIGQCDDQSLIRN